MFKVTRLSLPQRPLGPRFNNRHQFNKLHHQHRLLRHQSTIPAVLPSPLRTKKVRRKGTGLSTTGYTIFSAEHNKIVRQENPEAPFGELSRLIGLRWKALDADEKKVYEDRAKAKVAEATKVLEAKQKEEEKRK